MQRAFAFLFEKGTVKMSKPFSENDLTTADFSERFYNIRNDVKWTRETIPSALRVFSEEEQDQIIFWQNDSVSLLWEAYKRDLDIVGKEGDAVVKKLKKQQKAYAELQLAYFNNNKQKQQCQKSPQF